MLTDQALRGYEKYVLSNRSLQEALNILPQNSEDYLFLKVIHAMNESGLQKLSSDQEIKDAYKWLTERYYSDRKTLVMIREALLQYDAAKNDEERGKALDKIKGYCSWSHNHTKPNNLKRIRKANAEEVKGGAAEDTSEEEDPDLAQYPTAFKSEEEFSRQALIDQMINNNNAASIHPVRYTYFICLALLPQSQVPEFHIKYSPV
jgi:hypothetical protein